MNQDDYYRFHLLYYFVVSIIGGIFIFLGNRLPVYNEQTGEIIKPYSLPFIIFGVALIVISFIGIAFFVTSDDEEGDKK